MTKINRAPVPVACPSTFKESFVSFFQKSDSSLRAATQKEIDKPQVNIFKRTASAVKNSVSLGSIVSAMPFIPDSYKTHISANEEFKKTWEKPSGSGIASVVQSVGDFVGSLSPATQSAGSIISSIGGVSSETIAQKERRESVEFNAVVIKKIDNFSKVAKNESVVAIMAAIKSNLETQNRFHGAHTYVGYASSAMALAASTGDLAKITGAEDWGSWLKSGLSNPISMAISAGAALLPVSLTSMQWLAAEQNKDDAHSINAALQKAIGLERAVKNCRDGRQDQRINAAYADPDLCSFLGQWVETAPPEPPALNRNYVDYFVENYENVLNEMAKKLIQSSPGEFGLSLLHDLAKNPNAPGSKDAKEFCKLFKLDLGKSSEVFQKEAQKAFGLGA